MLENSLRKQGVQIDQSISHLKGITAQVDNLGQTATTLSRVINETQENRKNGWFGKLFLDTRTNLWATAVATAAGGASPAVLPLLHLASASAVLTAPVAVTAGLIAACAATAASVVQKSKYEEFVRKSEQLLARTGAFETQLPQVHKRLALEHNQLRQISAWLEDAVTSSQDMQHVEVADADEVILRFGERLIDMWSEYDELLFGAVKDSTKAAQARVRLSSTRCRASEPVSLGLWNLLTLPYRIARMFRRIAS